MKGEGPRSPPPGPAAPGRRVPSEGPEESESDLAARLRRAGERAKSHGEEPSAPAGPVPKVFRIRQPGGALDDLFVVAVALAIAMFGAAVYRAESRAALAPFSRAGLSLAIPAGWLPETAPPTEGGRFYLALVSPAAPDLRIEIESSPLPAPGNLYTLLAVQRLSRAADSYWGAGEARMRSIGGRDWLESRFQYVRRVGPSGSPQPMAAVEYGIATGGWLHTVAFHGPSTGDAAALAKLLAAKLRLDVESTAPQKEIF